MYALDFHRPHHACSVRGDSRVMIQVIDIFAGPGGLGEGFSGYRNRLGRNVFRVGLSIEKDPIAHKTLLLRSFYRQFPDGDAPDDYYALLRGEIGLKELFARHPRAAAEARKEAWNAELGNKKQFPSAEIDRRIRVAVGGTDDWILIGGPPCQAYSVVGRVRMRGANPSKHEQDPRHFLYREYLRILEEHHPSIFVMENVKGLLSATVGGESIIHLILNDLKSLKYRLHPFVAPPAGNLWNGNGHTDHPSSFVIRSENYGIPQTRHRLILLGVREGLNVQPRTLSPASRAVSLWDAIGDLPPIRSCLSRERDSGPSWVRAIEAFVGRGGGIMDIPEARLRTRLRRTAGLLNEGLGSGGEFVRCHGMPTFAPEWYTDRRLGGVCNHSARNHIATDLHRYLFAACFAREHGRSPVLANFPRCLLPKHENVDRGVRDGMFKDRFRVQLRSQPATTVTSHIAKDGHYFIHPDPRQCRSFTVREAARLQTFPDNYFFYGPRTSQYQQVGNAVPPLLARQLADAINTLFDSRLQHSAKSNGSPNTRETQLEHVPHPVAGHRS